MTHRLSGPRCRWNLEKNNAPRQNDRMAAKDFVQVYFGIVLGKSLTPRPAKIVLPVPRGLVEHWTT